MGTSLKHKDAGAGGLCDSVLVKAAGQMCLLNYPVCCPQRRWTSLALVQPRALSPINSVSLQMSGSPASGAPPRRTQKAGSQRQHFVFCALQARAARTSSVNNCPFSHGLFGISDETAEMPMRGVSLQSESSPVTPSLLQSDCYYLQGGRNPPCLLLYLFYDLGCC